VIAEELRPRPAVLLLQLFEEVGQGLRVVTRLPENDGADRIRLGFVSARVLQHHALRAKLNSLLRQLAADSAQGGARDGLGKARKNPGLLRLGHLPGRVLHVDVGHLVGHYPRELRLIVGCRDGSDVDEHGPAGQREGVDLLLRDDVEFIRPCILLGMVATSFAPSCRTYCVSGLLSGKTGIC
jgi:hypothetical protein